MPLPFISFRVKARGMLILSFLLSCIRSEPIISGSASAKGDGAHYLSLCERGDATALVLKAAAEASDCPSAWQKLATVTAVNLTSVDTISGLEALRDMENLQSLTAYGKGIEDLSPLSGLIRMETLYLVQNNIRDISPLEPLTQLRVLRLDGNAVSDISVVLKLPKLEKLGLDDNQIEDFRPILELDRIQALNTNKNPVKMEYCPIHETKGPKQLRKYCKRMKKHFDGLSEGADLQDAIDPKSPSPVGE